MTEIFNNLEIREQPTKAYNDWVRVFYDQHVPADVRQQIADACDKILLELQEQARGAGMQAMSRSVMDAYNQYAKLLADAMKDRQDRIAAAQQYYRNVVTDMPVQLKRQVDDAYQTYVRSLCTAWAEVDPETLGASKLWEINQSITRVLVGQIAALNAVSRAGPPIYSSAIPLFPPQSEAR